jgi:hypothetical protein
MKIFNPLISIFFCLNATTSLAQATLVSKQNIPIRLFTYTSGNYTGEVNSAGQPNGYGECVFADSVLYIGQFANGLISGEGITINKNSNNINIAKWRDGQIEGLYFRKQDKTLRLQENYAGISHYRRYCGFVPAGPMANVITGSTPATSSVVSFQVAKKELNDATVFFQPVVNDLYQGEGPTLSYLSWNRELNILDLANGDYVRTEPDTYDFLSDGLKEKLEAHIHKPMPEWLVGADFWKRDDNGELFFGRAHATEQPEGATNMEFVSNGSDGAHIRIAKLNRMLEPFGFMQEVQLSDGNQYRYMLGNITLAHGATGAHTGTGVIMSCFTDNDDFQLSAGDVRQSESGENVPYIHSGFTISYFGGQYTIALGNWDDQNSTGRGYYFALGNFLFRGPLKENILDGDGDAVKEKGIASKIHYGNNTITTITQVPAFDPITAPALFDRPFDIDL